jgi:hypothetical protein
VFSWSKMIATTPPSLGLTIRFVNRGADVVADAGIALVTSLARPAGMKSETGCSSPSSKIWNAVRSNPSTGRFRLSRTTTLTCTRRAAERNRGVGAAC